jgi:hypothetical protein
MGSLRCSRLGYSSTSPDVERFQLIALRACRKEHRMLGSGVSAVSAYTAHREWASRPPDERYQSVQALHDAARARRLRTGERTIDSGTLTTEAVASDASCSTRHPAAPPD